MKTLRAHGFNQRPRFEQVVGYLERNEPLPLDQPDRKATSFVTSHFYLDDFVQSSEDPNPRPCSTRPCKQFPRKASTLRKATDEDVRLARRYQGYGGTRFVEDDLAGDPEAGALASNGQGPPSITDRLRSTADGAQAAADLIGAEAAGLAAAQAFRSQLPQDAAEYVRLTVTWSASWTRRGSARRRWSAARCRPLRRRPRGRGRSLWLPGKAGGRGRCPGAHRGRGCWNWLARRELARRQRRGWPLGLQAAQPTAWRAARAGCWRTRSSGPSRAARTRPCRTSGPPTT